MANRTRDLIEGRVAALLSNREVALNVGSDAGVEPGMRFVILRDTGEVINDPETGEQLGEIAIPKHVVKIVRVEGPRMSVARTFRTVGARPGIAVNVFAPTPGRVEELNVAWGSTVKDQIDSEDLTVVVGDRVIETVGDEYDT